MITTKKGFNKIEETDFVKTALSNTDSAFNLNVDCVEALLDSKADAGHDHNTAYEPKNANLQSHVASKSNPHGVTVAQIGAATSGHNHDAAYEAKNVNIQSHIVNKGNPHGVTVAQIGAAASGHNHDAAYEVKNTNIQSHITNKENPHGVTIGQIGAAASTHTHTLSGLGAAAVGHNHDTTYEAKNENIQTHIASKSNPHGVTIGQIGAAATLHTHNKSQITDFPTSLPASGGNADSVGGKTLAALLLAVYPVGAIYMSASGEDPGTLFGGTWVAWGAGRVPVGVNAADKDFETVEKNGGNKNMQQHTHTFSGSAVTSAGASVANTGNTSINHAHTFTGAAADVSHSHSVSGGTGDAGAHGHNLWGGTRYLYLTGNGSTANVWQIGGLSSNTGNGLLTAEAVGNHAHDIWGTAAHVGLSHAHGGTVGAANPSHTHTIAHTHSVTANGTIGNAGAGTAQNLQPYITCYMWKRTA